jgi:hypothetical protein
MQHAIQYLLLAFIAGNALWQGYTAALANSTAVEVVMATYRIVDLTVKPWEH